MTVARTTAHYRNRRQRITDYMGGHCAECGSDGTGSKLMLQHDDPDLRPSFSFSLVVYMAWERLAGLLADAELLCAKCHREINGGNVGQNQVNHGGGGSGKHNCKCRPCKDKKNEYMREWRRGRRHAEAVSDA